MKCKHGLPRQFCATCLNGIPVTKDDKVPNFRRPSAFVESLGLSSNRMRVAAQASGTARKGVWTGNFSKWFDDNQAKLENYITMVLSRGARVVVTEDPYEWKVKNGCLFRRLKGTKGRWTNA